MMADIDAIEPFDEVDNAGSGCGNIVTSVSTIHQVSQQQETKIETDTVQVRATYFRQMSTQTTTKSTGDGSEKNLTQTHELRVKFRKSIVTVDSNMAEIHVSMLQNIQQKEENSGEAFCEV